MPDFAYGIFSQVAGMFRNVFDQYIKSVFDQQSMSYAAELNYKLGEQSAENAYNRGLNFYRNFQSPGAMVEQLKAAGLNPALMYSKGAGGSSGFASTQGSGAGNQQGKAFDVRTGQDALLMAQIQNINADTNLKNAEAGKSNQETTNLSVTFDKIIAETSNIKAQTNLLNLQSDYQDLDNFVKSSTLGSEIHLIEQSARKVDNEATDMYYLGLKHKAESYITEQSRDTLVEINNAQLANIVADSALKYSNITLNEQQKQYLIDMVNYYNMSNIIDNNRVQYMHQDEVTKLLQQTLMHGTDITQQNIKMSNDNVMQITSHIFSLFSSLAHASGMYYLGSEKQLLQNRYDHWKQTHSSYVNRMQQIQNNDSDYR